MSNQRKRKKGLEEIQVLSPIGNAPASKRNRVSATNVSVSRPRLLPRRAELRPDAEEPPRQPTRKRQREHLPRQSESEPPNDENKDTDLEESLKRLRIRTPMVFSITSFIEQSVGSVSYNLTDQQPQLVPESDA